MIENYGKFAVYSLPDDHPLKPLEERGAVFRRSPQKGDWYEFQKLAPAGRTYATVRDNGDMVSVENDISRINPLDFTVIAMDRYDGDLWDLRGSKRIDLATGALTDIPV